MIVVDLTVLMPFVAGTQGRVHASRVSHRDPVWIVPPPWRLAACDWALGYIRNVGGTAMDAQGLILAADMLVRESHEEIGTAEVIAAAYPADLSIHQLTYMLTARRIGAALVTADPAVLAAFPDLAVPANLFGAS